MNSLQCFFNSAVMLLAVSNRQVSGTAAFVKAFLFWRCRSLARFVCTYSWPLSVSNVSFEDLVPTRTFWSHALLGKLWVPVIVTFVYAAAVVRYALTKG